MGRYLGLAEMGTYGLIAAYIGVVSIVLGMKLDFAVSREIVDRSHFEAALRMRDQLVFYGINYFVLILVAAIVTINAPSHISTNTITLTLVLAILENLASMTFGNLVSLRQPVRANALFFVRAGLWIFPVIIVGILAPAYRTSNFIFSGWICGVTLSLVGTALSWRNLPWPRVMAVPVDWVWIKSSVQSCFLIWIGALGAVAYSFIDRFTVEHFLTREYVGIISFYGSFVIAIDAMVTSGVSSYAYPRLIAHFRNHDHTAFRREAWLMTSQASSFSGVLALSVGLGVPLLGREFGRPEFSEHSTVLWLMLLAAWVRDTTSSLYYVLYARHQDNLIWITGVFSLLPALATSIILVPRYGLEGVGYSAVVTAVTIGIWRFYCVRGSDERTAKIVPPHAV